VIGAPKNVKALIGEGANVSMTDKQGMSLLKNAELKKSAG
jgi:hypothetical protein